MSDVKRILSAIKQDDQKTGNDGTLPVYSASYHLDNIISVAGIDHNDALVSNFGLTSVDLAGPGPGSSEGLRIWSIASFDTANNLRLRK